MSHQGLRISSTRRENIKTIITKNVIKKNIMVESIKIEIMVDDKEGE